MINRRAFLSALGFGTVTAAAAAMSFDVDRLLWVAGEKTVFLPPVQKIELAHTMIDANAARQLAIRMMTVGNAHLSWEQARDVVRKSFRISDPLSFY